MSTFKVEIVRLDEVVPHPNADRLDLCKIKGWTCVAQRGLYKPESLAVYIPLDAVLPNDLVTKLGIEKMYHKRIRTAKLRGVVSQGLLAPLEVLPAGLYPGPRGQEKMPTPGDDVTDILGITKYEEPIPVHMSGVALPQNPRFPVYTDIENLKNYPSAFSPGELVVATEKLHGTNARATVVDGQLFVGSHRMNLKENEGNLYWRAAKILNLKEKLQEGEQVFFEVYGSGVQDMSYGCKQGEIQVAVFDFMKEGQYLSYLDFVQQLIKLGWEDLGVPVVYVGEWDPIHIYKVAQGNSLVALDQIKEGLVIKPVVERHSDLLQGRCIVKAISDEYYLRKNGSENH